MTDLSVHPLRTVPVVCCWVLLLLLGCASNAAVDDPPVTTGAERLARTAFEPLAGRRVGLIVNHTARVDTVHLVDLLHEEPSVELVALFGPEHGIRGRADAGEAVPDGRDERTGVPIYSLYGAGRTPAPEMLDGLDALVFDIQDVGARFYTYISTMGRAMQAAAAHDVSFYVLDRPNPLGGTYVSGFVLEPEHTSFVGQYPIPVAHGMTVGELARMIRGEGLLPGMEDLDLHVVPMQGWRRAMRWPQTGLPWTAPSPNLPTVEAALVYAGTCFVEATAASEGRGTRTPFTLIGAPWADGRALAGTLRARSLPGVRFEEARFTPRAIEGMSSHPKLEGTALDGVRIHVTDVEAIRPVELGIHVLHALHGQAPDTVAFFDRGWLAQLAGTERLHAMLADSAAPDAIAETWQDEVETFREHRTPYLLYE